ncbi:MAG: NUDIX hydrolase [Anaerolineaceae bacterium]|nr:NUDIX hydrolase [Anaerolineaceae bacterium]
MPSVSVAAIITRMQDDELEILLTKRADNMPTFPGAWVLPGGRVDEYERREQAVIREVKEETGVDFYPTFFGVYDEIFEERQIHAVVTVYEGPCDGEMVADEYEVSEIGWFSLEAALKHDLDLGFEHRTILTDYANHHASR